MTLFRLTFTLLLLTLPLLSQTRVTTPQLAGDAVASGAIFVVLPSGLVAQASLGAGLAITLDGNGKPVISASAPPVVLPIYVVGERPAVTSPVVFTLAFTPAPGSLKVFRNGIRQDAPGDYSLSGRTITFIPAYASDLTPIVVCDYQR